jgi:prephenate dehydratase
VAKFATLSHLITFAILLGNTQLGSSKKRTIIMKVAIQGGDASFHDIVAIHLFSEKAERVKCASFKELCQSLVSGQSDFAVMAIENTIAGSILPNYALIRSYGLKIIAEIKLRIILNLMALPGQKIENLVKVKSHYMALMQCAEFLSKYPNASIEEYYDTADAAKDIATRKLVGEAAIAPKYAAQLYHLELLAEGIETYKENFTRFLVLARPDYIYTGEKNKASLSFQLSDDVGSLAHVLTELERLGINLSKIQSLPLLGDPFKYSFYIDCEWATGIDFELALSQLQRMTNNLVVLGIYKKGETILS